MHRKFFFILVAALAFSLPASSARGAVSGWQKGATLVPKNSTDFSSGSFRQSISNLAATHANFVTLVIPIRQSSIYSTDVGTAWNTPTDQSLIDGINYAHSLGLKVMLKPHLDSDDGQWRANINPSDRAGWFTSYGNVISRYAQLAQQNGVEQFCLGTELISMAAYTSNGTNTSNWTDLISKIRPLYSGKLTYSANWGPSGFVDEKDNIGFWSQLDYIGISAYFNLSTGSNDVGSLKSSWDAWQGQIASLSNQFGKPALFTEIGYRSVTGSHQEPWNYGWPSWPPDQTEQANAYEALFQYWNNFGYMTGIHIWEWSTDPNAGGSGDTGYTPQNKTAQSTITSWFGSGGGTQPPPGGSNASFSANASVNPQSPASGQTVSISANFTNNGSQAGNLLTDVEIYDSQNRKVFQSFVGGQSFSSGQTQTYTFSWTPSSAGTYSIKAGVFSSDWSQNYYWTNDAGSISVGASSGGGSTPPPSGNYSTDIWWPTSGVTVSGMQPFKIMVQGLPLSQYSSFWQVDNGSLNQMQDSSQDYPHKESIVDLSGWAWRGNGPYSLNFISKNQSGQIISQTGIGIYVSH